MERSPYESGFVQKLNNNRDLLNEVRKIYFCAPAIALKDELETEFLIKDDTSKYFRVGIHCVQIAGSAKLGYSFRKKRKFDPEHSDCDLAIINPDIFSKYLDKLHSMTNGFTNLGEFKRRSDGRNDYELLRSQVVEHGLLNFDLLPNNALKDEVSTFTNMMSRKYNEFFRSISVVIFASSYGFETKQAKSLQLSLGAKK